MEDYSNYELKYCIDKYISSDYISVSDGSLLKLIEYSHISDSYKREIMDKFLNYLINSRGYTFADILSYRQDKYSQNVYQFSTMNILNSININNSIILSEFNVFCLNILNNVHWYGIGIREFLNTVRDELNRIEFLKMINKVLLISYKIDLKHIEFLMYLDKNISILLNDKVFNHDLDRFSNMNKSCRKGAETPHKPIYNVLHELLILDESDNWKIASNYITKLSHIISMDNSIYKEIVKLYNELYISKYSYPIKL